MQRPENDKRRPLVRAAKVTTNLSNPSVNEAQYTDQAARAALTQLIRAIDLQETMMIAAITDAVRQASADYWSRRASEFEAVGTPEADQTALACTRHSWLLRHMSDEPWPGYTEDLAAVLGEREAAA